MNKVRKTFARCALLFILAAAIQSVLNTVNAVTKPVLIDSLWTMPQSVVQLNPDGSVGLLKVRKDINAALDAKRFSCYSAEKKAQIPGGAKAWSNQADAEKIMDGRTDTWWTPRPGDPLEQWVIELDLGRAVATKRIRLVFADALGVEPFERFRVYISEGATISTIADTYRYKLLARQALPNREKVLEYPVLFTEFQDTTKAGVTLKRGLDFDLVRFVRVVLDSKGTNPALAELEVDAIGDNIALETLRNRGSIDAHYKRLDGPKLFDGDAGTNWRFPPVTDQEWEHQPATVDDGAWFEWDLGAAFRIDEFFLSFGAMGPYGITWGIGGIGGEPGAPCGYLIYVSDGSPRPGGALEGKAAGRFDYRLLVDVENLQIPHRTHFHHPVEPMKVRYIFFRAAHGIGNYGRGYSPLFEMQLFGEGYPPEATLISPPLSIAALAGSSGEKLITSLKWDAEQDFPLSRVAIQTRTGETVDTVSTYYRKDGKEVSKAEYLKLPSALRGRVDSQYQPGEGWNDWSMVYADPEGPFLSPSPSLFGQFKIKLVSEQPDLAPVLRSLSIDLVEPLVRSITGAVDPRTVRDVDLPQDYRYHIWPVAAASDRGFDQVLITAPLVEGTPVLLEIDGIEADLDSVEFRADSLWVKLPRRVKGDSLAIQFTARVPRNGVWFNASVANSSLPGVWQGVAPAKPGAITIFLPALAETGKLIGNLRITPNVFTPNKDGINDQLSITFSLLKVEKVEGITPPTTVAIFNLNGEMVKELVRSPGSEERYVWDGDTETGKLVSPGVYLCQIKVDSDSGTYSEQQTIGVVY